jgi:hypothetical protein
VKTLMLNLPPGSVQRGRIYRDSGVKYGLGDVLEVELSSGYTIDLGWDENDRDKPFRVVVYREYFGDRCVDFSVATVDEAVEAVESLALRLSEPIVYSSRSSSCSHYASWNDTLKGSGLAVASSLERYDSLFDGSKTEVANSQDSYYSLVLQ